MRNSLTLVLAAALLAGSAAMAGATTIDTTPFWNGSSSVGDFGGNSTGVYGETFTAPGGALTSYTFYVNNSGSALTVVPQVYAWSGNPLGGNPTQGAVGPALFTGAEIAVAGSDSFQAVTVQTGGVALTPGNTYVALLADVVPGDGDSVWGLDGFDSHPGVTNDNGFNFYNNDHTLASISANPWDDFNDFGSLAWTATFSTSVPEPATLALLGIGLAGLGAARRRRA